MLYKSLPINPARPPIIPSISVANIFNAKPAAYIYASCDVTGNNCKDHIHETLPNTDSKNPPIKLVPYSCIDIYVVLFCIIKIEPSGISGQFKLDYSAGAISSSTSGLRSSTTWMEVPRAATAASSAGEI